MSATSLRNDPFLARPSLGLPHYSDCLELWYTPQSPIGLLALCLWALKLGRLRLELL